MASRDFEKVDIDYTNDFFRKLGARIRSVRKAKGYSSYEEFGNKFNVSRAQIGRYENGKNLEIRTLVKLLKALEISWAEFFSEGFD